MNTNTSTARVLKVMYLLTWIAFIGVMIETSAILVSYVVSCINPAAAEHLYKKLDLEGLRQFSFRYYTLSVSFMFVLGVMKALALFLVINAMSRVNLVNPFKREVARLLEWVSYILLCSWIIAVVNNQYADWVLKRTGFISPESPTDELMFMAGIVFIISQIFKRGVEIQTENDLTV